MERTERVGAGVVSVLSAEDSGVCCVASGFFQDGRFPVDFAAGSSVDPASDPASAASDVSDLSVLPHRRGFSARAFGPVVAAGLSTEEDDEADEDDEAEVEAEEDEDAVSSAHAWPANTADPMPRATANAPTRPTYAAELN
ncbi:hypothetical protein [Mycolicibacterium obuense]|uniref:hypothetical protein n=1 Tax=Mycolicibacterium obuense TaxID=1807 RepID=UPI002E8179AF|nr:hypothetical protein [Mycolicibacterium obuense]